METFRRRDFLSVFQRAIAGAAFLPLTSPTRLLFAHPQSTNEVRTQNCWLDVCAPFIVECPAAGLHSQIVLTADNFSGQRGYLGDSGDETEYEIYLYDAAGNAVGPDGVARRLSVPAMRTTVIPVSELLRSEKNFWGGMTVRLRPGGRVARHASDLFSSAFVRWETKYSFTNVHANPDPLQWQLSQSFFYSMPFPPLADYSCVASLFNPNPTVSRGTVALYDPVGTKMSELPYELPPHSSLMLDLASAGFVNDIETVLERLETRSSIAKREPLNTGGGTIVVINHDKSAKTFGYLFMMQPNRALFSVEHPIHQPPLNPLPTTSAFDSAGRLAAKNVLYTPLVFRSKRIGGLTLDSRFHFSSGAPMEQHLWLKPFIVDSQGDVAWQVTETDGFPSTIAKEQIERGAIKLGARQSCVFDCSKTKLPNDFSGGMALAITPNSNHTLMKVEITAREWGASAFTHFRPGLKSARAYQLPPHRGGIATDYIASGAHLNVKGGKVLRDEIIGVINIDDKGAAGNPSLEIFDHNGFINTVQLGRVAPFSCRHYLLSELLSGKISSTDLTLRLVDETATLLMSILHLDYGRRDIAADHGSDRFSTFGEFDCKVKKI